MSSGYDPTKLLGGSSWTHEVADRGSQHETTTTTWTFTQHRWILGPSFVPLFWQLLWISTPHSLGRKVGSQIHQLAQARPTASGATFILGKVCGTLLFGSWTQLRVLPYRAVVCCALFPASTRWVPLEHSVVLSWPRTEQKLRVVSFTGHSL